MSLYCAAGGIAPHRVLPVVIDVGTDNEELLNDKFYLGVQKKRLHGKAYYEVIDEFMQAVRYRWPNVLVQFEDFSSDKAQVRRKNHNHTFWFATRYIRTFEGRVVFWWRNSHTPLFGAKLETPQQVPSQSSLFQ